MRIAHLRS